MGIEANCGQCGKQYTVPDRWAGKRVQCPRCQAAVDIPVHAVNVVVTNDTEPAPVVKPPTGTNPFARSQTSTGNRHWKDSPGPQQPNSLKSLQAKPAANLSEKFLRGTRLMIAVGIGMGLVLVWALVVAFTTGFGFWLLPHAFLLAAGVTILMGGVNKRPGRRNTANVKNRRVRIVGWFFAGLCGAGAALAGMWIMARMGVPVPMVTIVGTPLLLVPLLVSFVAAILLAYNLLMLTFPQADILRVAAIGYVALTLVIPVVMIPIGIVRGLASDDRQAATAQAAPPVAEQGNALADKQASWPTLTPPPNRPQSTGSRPRTLGQGGTLPDGGALPETGGADPPARSPLGNTAGTVGGFPGRQLPGRNRPGPGFRGPPSSRAGAGRGGPPGGARSFESSVAMLVARFGAERVVTVFAEPVEGDQFPQISDAIRTAAHASRTGYAAALSNGMLRAAVGPVNDIQAFSERLDIGDVVGVDPVGRTVTVEVKAP